MFATGEKWWADDEADATFIADAAGEADQRFEVDVWEQLIETYLHNDGSVVGGRFVVKAALTEPRRDVKIIELLHDVLDMSASDITKVTRNRVAAILKRLGYTYKTVRPKEKGAKTFGAYNHAG
jgi:predicted P-loop ATPase